MRGWGPGSMMDRNFLARAFEMAATPVWYPLLERTADARLPVPVRAPLFRALARLGGIDLSEVDGPLERFASLGEFFARPLRHDARPVDPDAAAWVSPADGVLQAVGSFAAGRDPVVPVKGAALPIGRALGPHAEAVSGGGHYFVVYLAPNDYHRVHSPVSGRVRSWQSVPGTRLPVNRLGFRLRPDVLSSNERVILELEATRGGTVFVVLVAAFGVARTRLTFVTGEELRARAGGAPVALDPPIPVVRGEEIGSFNLGSTVLVIWPAPGHPVLWMRRAGAVRVGEGVVRGAPAGAG
ncbi:MAG: phosphatidylserine decarboxylase [Deltaproteobacteria bacterium]|nr:phosphatidylserine decarboxylase [Deltaproteobacteria bacterium]